MQPHINSPDKLAQLLSEKVQKRFWSKVRIGGLDECWNWSTATIKGYGRFGIRSGWNEFSHRMAWISTHKMTPPEDKPFVLHSCIGNRMCCNPVHLRCGTAQDNVDDRTNQGRERHPEHHRPGLKGSRSPRAKLTDSDVLTMRSIYSPKKFTAKMIAKIFGISLGNTYAILHRKAWTHI